MATESSNVTKERTVCKCGHHISQHRMEMEDKQCSVCSCWDFPNMHIRERVLEGESAKQKTSKSQPLTSVQKKSKSKPRQPKQPSKSNKNDNGDDEKRFIPFFEAAIHSIDKLTSDFHEKKKRIVEKLAVTLKNKGFRVDGIANEIVHQLKGRASRSWILEILDDEYKDKTYQENARNRRKAAPLAEQLEGSLTEQHRTLLENGISNKFGVTPIKSLIMNL